VHAVRVGFISGLNEILLVGASLALVAAVLTLLLIRSKDFEVGAARGPQTGPPETRPGSSPMTGPGSAGSPDGRDVSATTGTPAPPLPRTRSGKEPGAGRLRRHCS